MKTHTIEFKNEICEYHNKCSININIYTIYIIFRDRLTCLGYMRLADFRLPARLCSIPETSHIQYVITLRQETRTKLGVAAMKTRFNRSI